MLKECTCYKINAVATWGGWWTLRKWFVCSVRWGNGREDFEIFNSFLSFFFARKYWENTYYSWREFYDLINNSILTFLTFVSRILELKISKVPDLFRCKCSSDEFLCFVIFQFRNF